MARNYACLKHEYLEEMSLLTDAEFGRLCRALLAYSADGKEGQLQGSERLFWPRVKMQEDRAVESYNASIEKYSAAGRAGAATRANNAQRRSTTFNDVQQRQATMSNVEQRSTSPSKYKSESEKESEYESEKENNPPDGGKNSAQARVVFAPPTVEQVAEYCLSRQNNIEAQEFVDFYTSKGWMVGSNRMKDWKAAVRTWEQRKRQEGEMPF